MGSSNNSLRASGGGESVLFVHLAHLSPPQRPQESTSEDVNFFYAMTMWAIATGNSALEGLGRLQTGVVKRSINEYFLLKDSNTNHPPDFVKNKVHAGVSLSLRKRPLRLFSRVSTPGEAKLRVERNCCAYSHQWHLWLDDLSTFVCGVLQHEPWMH